MKHLVLLITLFINCQGVPSGIKKVFNLVCCPDERVGCCVQRVFNESIHMRKGLEEISLYALSCCQLKDPNQAEQYKDASPKEMAENVNFTGVNNCCSSTTTMPHQQRKGR